MKVSLFIKKLQEIKDKHGDVVVYVFEPEDLVRDSTMVKCQAHITLGEDESEKVTDIVICDSETYMAFK